MACTDVTSGRREMPVGHADAPLPGHCLLTAASVSSHRVVVGCSNHSDSSRRKKKPTNTNFFRIPRIVVDRYERSKTLSTNQGTLWLARNNRADLDLQNPNLRVCGAHFVTAR
ncbi:hypothetical protein HPB49_005800 [Dermacentor silvarum]|uniref:Uncharacterized protein n=1 Tax=Dermacentor silvarum TaxID=543639 RepID=A0ACB8DWP0_DERSI|nr:hypothetical protein HPB49_005800 [Dermacentor silvarum]